MPATINYYGRLFDSNNITPAIAKAAHIAKAYGEGLIKARTPVDTSRLKNSWKLKLEGNGIRINNDTPYAGFVEFGTVKMAPRLMMTSSMPDIQDAFIDALYSEIGEAIGNDLLTDFAKPGYGSAVNPNKKYPEVGRTVERPIGGGLSKRTKKTTKKYLFPNPNKILSKKQEEKIANARPLLQRRGAS